MDKDSKGQRKNGGLWQRATSCSGRTQPRIEQNGRTPPGKVESGFHVPGSPGGRPATRPPQHS